MSSLINTRIQDTYTGLIKTADNLPVDGTLKNLEDGNGGVLPMQVSTTGVNFTGTVTGLPVAEAGLVAGAAANSMESSASLTTTAANAITAGSIAIGDGAIAGATAYGGRAAIAIGQNAVAATDFGDFSVAIGFNVKNVRDAGVALGRNLNQSIGTEDHYRPINIGSGGNVRGGDVIGIGTDVNIQGTASNNKIAIGTGATVTDVEGAVALGAGVTADKANTVSVKALDIQTPSTPTDGGIIMTDAGSTERRINITATGELQIDSTPVGGGGAAGLVNGTGTDSLKQADTLTTNAATASGPQSIALGNGAVANNNQSIAIGNYSESTGLGGAAIGEYASANGLYSSAWGRTAYARAEGSVAFGQQAGVPDTIGLAGAVAMGRQVVAVDGDTTHVRALYIVAPDGGTGGNGITMLSPNGTAYKITVSDAGVLVVTAV